MVTDNTVTVIKRFFIW